jgi:hypothetical protein
MTKGGGSRQNFACLTPLAPNEQKTRQTKIWQQTLQKVWNFNEIIIVTV